VDQLGPKEIPCSWNSTGLGPLSLEPEQVQWGLEALKKARNERGEPLLPSAPGFRPE